MSQLNTKLKRRGFLAGTSAAALAASGAAKTARAQTAKDPALLKTTLTPMGAERAGNADGSIPAWTGGYTTVPAGYVSGQPRPDPFADEKPLFSITAANAAQYEAKLPVGAMQMLQRYPTYRIDVYPTHRTACATQEVYDNAALNVTRTQISADGTTVSNAFGAPPFPIPTTGSEVVWNHLTAWQGPAVKALNSNYVITNGGDRYLSSLATVTSTLPYYAPGGTPETFQTEHGGIYKEYIIDTIGPAYQAGIALMAVAPLNQAANPPKTMQYLPGQHRVREAPDLAYDEPNFLDGGESNFDETFVYDGRLDQYDFKLIGKREMFLPYNNNKCWLTPYEVQLGPKHYNPDVLRWELRRAWVVELTLLPGARNVDARRTLYIEEDCWCALACDVYDAGGSFWKFSHALAVNCYEVPCVLGSATNVNYDLHKGDYSYNVGCDPTVNELQFKQIDPLPATYYSATTLVGLAGGS